MKRFIVKAAAMAAAAFLAAVAVPQAAADTVTLSTTGAFTSPAGGVTLGSGGSFITIAGGGSKSVTLAFAGINSTVTDTLPDSNVVLGVFTETFTGSGEIPNPGGVLATFTLTIHQTAPPGADVSTGRDVTLTGGIKASDSNTFLVEFDPTSWSVLSVPPILYTLKNLNSAGQLTITTGQQATTEVLAEIGAGSFSPAVPLPKSAWCGLALLGSVGLMHYRRHRLAA